MSQYEKTAKTGKTEDESKSVAYGSAKLLAPLETSTPETDFRWKNKWMIDY